MHQQPHDRAPMPSAEGHRPGLAAPRLDLPRFQFRETPPPARAPQPAPRPAPQQHAPQVQYAPQPAQPQYAQPHVPQQVYHQQYAQPQAPMHATPQANATAMRQPVAVTYAQSPPVRPMPVATRPPVRPPVRQPLASTTRPAAVAWTPPPAEPTLLQRITPVHMGVMMALVMVFMVMSSGPSTMKINPVRLPALANGGGTSGDPLLAPRSGATAVDAATAAGAAKARAAKDTAPAARTATPAATRAAAARRARLARANRAWIVVGNARVRRNVRSGGIPSPAAAANLQVAGGGRVAAGSTQAVNLNGIPSAAAAEELGPRTLPYRPNDGVTLPRMVGERDGHALDSHYGSDVLPMEEAVATPALTPGAAAEQAQHRVAINELTHGSAAAPPVNGGLIVGY